MRMVSSICEGLFGISSVARTTGSRDSSRDSARVLVPINPFHGEIARRPSCSPRRKLTLTSTLRG